MDRPAQQTHRSWFLVTLTTMGIVAAGLTPVAAVGTWLLVTDPEVAGKVAAGGSLLPIAAAIAQTLARALVNAFAYL
jgi:hypothetical protein